MGTFSVSGIFIENLDNVSHKTEFSASSQIVWNLLFETKNFEILMFH